MITSDFMEHLPQKIKDLGEVPFPKSLHLRIMTKLMFLYFRTPFLVIVSLLSLNLAVSSWRLWSKITQNQAHLIIADLLKAFEWDSLYLRDLAKTFSELVPVGLVVSFLISALLLGYLFYLSSSFKKFQRSNLIN